MKNELLSLESEPLWYFLLHSGVFVAGLGAVFFLLGLIFGALTWGRYKKQTRHLKAEGAVLREEIAGLKRKLAEQVVSRPGTAPLQSPPPALLTEVLPKVSEIFPERATATASAPATATIAPTASVPAPVHAPIPASASAAAPAASREPLVPVPTSAPIPTPTPAPAASPAEIPSLPLIPESALIPAPAPEPREKDFITKPVFRRPAAEAPKPAPFIPPQPLLFEEDEVTPFSFLLQPPEPEPEPEAQPEQEPEPDVDPTFDPEESAHLSLIASSLSDIISPAATAKTPEVSPPPSVIPENDQSLGLIFKERPADVDDLTRLQGVSPAIQNRLQELGIYRLQQIATWNQTHVREFSRRLAFKDRIERERWVEQARRLMMGEPI